MQFNQQQKVIKDQNKMVQIKISSIYNREITKETFVKYEPTKTQQNQIKEQDINFIMSKYAETGIIGDGLGTRKPQFGDYTGVDFREMQTKLAESNQIFEALPSGMRTRFENKVENLLDFIDDEQNRDEAIKWGFLPQPPEEPSGPEKREVPVGDPQPPGREQEPEKDSKQASE